MTARFGRLAALIVVLAGMGSMASGCLTVATWRWALTPQIDGEMVGVYRNSEGPDVVVYRLGAGTGYDPGYYGFWVPENWNDGDPSEHTGEDGVRVLQFNAGITLEALDPASVPMREAMAPVPVFRDRGRMAKRRIAGEPRKAHTDYRIVRQVDPDGVVIHELYAWSIEYDGWALLGSGRLGQGETKAWVAGVLTPFTLVADTVVTLVWAIIILASSAR